MTERPIIFSGSMVRALLDGRKTQTRRLAWQAKAEPAEPCAVTAMTPDGGRTWFRRSPWQRVQPGERLWVREAWSLVPASAYRCSEGVQQTLNPTDPYDAAIYRAGWDRSTSGLRWRPSIHMPRWASRLTLTVTEVRVQRLQEISEEDAVAEGATSRPACYGHRFLSPGWSMDWGTVRDSDDTLGSARAAFGNLWNSLHGADAWASNPEVVALTFTVERRA